MVSAEQREAAAKATQEQGAKETAQRKEIESQIAAANARLRLPPGFGGSSAGKTFAQVQLEKLYKESGVVTDSGGNVIYNPADLGAERERAQKEITGQPFATISGSPSPQYQASVNTAAQRAIDLRQAKVTTALQEKQKEQTELERSEQQARQELESVESKLNAPQVLGSTYVDKNTGATIKRYQSPLSHEEADRLVNQKQSLKNQLASIESKKKSLGADISSLQKANRDIISFKTSTKSYAGIFQTTQKSAVQALQEKKDASALSIMGARAGIKSVVEPIQYTALRDSGVTARTYKQLKGKPATPENLLGISMKPIVPRNTFLIGQAGGKAPSRGKGQGGFEFNPFGNATEAITKQLGFSTSIQKFPAKQEGIGLLPSAFAEPPQTNIDYSGVESTLNDIREKGGRQVTITSPSGKKTTVPIDQALDVIKGAPQKGAYGFEYFPAPTPEQRAQKISVLKANQKKIFDVLENARSTGANEITIIEKSGKRTTVPISRAFYDITKSLGTSPELSFEYGGISATEKTASISAAQKSAVRQIGDFTKQAKADFADEITITREDGTKMTVPLAQAQLEVRRATAGGKKVELSYVPLPKPITLTDAAREVERITGLGGIASPGLAYIDKALQLDLPYQQRSKTGRTIPGIPANIYTGFSNYGIGNIATGFANIGAEVYDFTKATAKNIKMQYPFVEVPSKGSIFPRLKTTEQIKGETPFVPDPTFGLPIPRKQTPQQESAVSDIFSGKPVDLTSGEFHQSLAGEGAVQVALYFLLKGSGGTIGSLGKVGKIKEPSTKLKVIESYEIPDTMRKPPGEKPRSFKELYTEPLRLETPEQLLTKQTRESNIAFNVMKARTEELIGKGAERIALRYNPATQKIQGEYVGFGLGRGRGFVPEGGFGGGPPAGRPPTGGTPTVKVTRISDTAKIEPATPDIFESPVYESLGKAEPETVKQASRSGVDIRFPDSTIEDTAARGPSILTSIVRTNLNLGRGIGRKVKPSRINDNRFIDSIVRSIKVNENIGAVSMKPKSIKPDLLDLYPFSARIKLGSSKVTMLDADLLRVVPENLPKAPIRYVGGRLRIRFPDSTIEDTAARGPSRFFKTTRIPLGEGKPISLDVGVRFPSLSITPIKETKPSVKPRGQPKLKLEEKSMIEKQVEKIVSLDIDAARAERSAVKEVELKVNIDDLFRRAGFKKTYRTRPDILPTIYEPQTAKVVRKAGIGKAILEGRPINLGPRGLPTAARIRGARRPLVTIPRLDFAMPRTVQLETPKTKTRRKAESAVFTIPITAQPSKTKTVTVPALDIPEKQKTRTAVITIPDIPQETITELRFPVETPLLGRGGFLPPFGGRGGGTRRRTGRTRKIFYTNPSDPLRAGVIMAQGVPELASRSPKVFKQVDVLLGKSRKRNKWAGLDQPYRGLNIKDTFSRNLNIKI